jgi:hypothetical protein
MILGGGTVQISLVDLNSTTVTTTGDVAVGDDLTVAGDATITGTATAGNLSGTNTGDVTLAAVGSSPSANGASLSGQQLTLQPADATHPGVVTTGTQALAGDKTLAGDFSPSASGARNLGGASNTWLRAFVNVLTFTGVDRLSLFSSGLNSHKDAVSAPDGSSIAHLFDTNNAYSTAGGHLLEVRNAFALKTWIGKDGEVGVGGIGSLPTASATSRGALWVVLGGGGVADELFVCLKAAGGTYSWKSIVAG